MPLLQCGGVAIRIKPAGILSTKIRYHASLLFQELQTLADDYAIWLPKK